MSILYPYSVANTERFLTFLTLHFDKVIGLAVREHSNYGGIGKLSICN